jgi:hypothetical protein
MSITTEEVERLAERVEDEGGLSIVADALRDLAAERDYLEKIAIEAAQCHADETKRADKLQAEVERLKAGGCARDQSTTQYCAEAVALQADNARLREALRAFPGFVDDATIGDVWIERKNAALGGEGNE